MDHDLYAQFHVGDRVMVKEGYPGQVVAVEDGPFPQTERYQVMLDNGAGAGSWSASELSPLLEGLEGTAAVDYPVLAEVLVQRPPPAIVSTAGIFTRMIDNYADRVNERLPQDLQYQRGSEWSYDYCRYRKNSHCMYPKELDGPATEAAGYPVWKVEDRGTCPRVTWAEQERCPIGAPGPNATTAAYSQDFTVQASSELGWHLTARWSDVKAKAKRIRAEVTGDTATYETELVRSPGRSELLGLGSLTDQPEQLMHEAMEADPFRAIVDGQEELIVGIEDDQVVLVRDLKPSAPVPDAQVLHPSYHPSLGLNPALEDAGEFLGVLQRHAQSDGAMIAIVPPLDVAMAIADAVGDDSELAEMHLTLAFLGKAAEVDAQAVKTAVMAFAAFHAPFEATIAGWGAFSNGDEHVLWASVDAPVLPQFRQELLGSLDAVDVTYAANHGFTPHVSASYADEPFGWIPTSLPQPSSWTVDQLAVVIGDEWTFYPLFQPSPVVGAMYRTAQDSEVASPTHAGLCLKAQDTGRILMLQRSLHDDNDAAAGTWEWPGGGLEPDDLTTLHGAIREWEEEIGQQLPSGGVVAHTWTSPDGVWQGHLVVVPEEDAIRLTEGRIVPNPDDPDQDDAEQAAWWEIDHARDNPALRTECVDTPWEALKTAVLLDEPEPALPSTTGEDELEKSARVFSPAEQHELISEGDGVMARNLEFLDLSGTHYDQAMEDELIWS